VDGITPKSSGKGGGVEIKSFMLHVEMSPGEVVDVDFDPGLKRAMLMNMTGQVSVTSPKWYSDNAGTNSVTNDKNDLIPGTIREAKFFVTVGEVVEYLTSVGDILMIPTISGLSNWIMKNVIVLANCPVKISSVRAFDLKQCATTIFKQKIQIWLPNPKKPHQENNIVTGKLCSATNLYELDVLSGALAASANLKHEAKDQLVDLQGSTGITLEAATKSLDGLYTSGVKVLMFRVKECKDALTEFKFPRQDQRNFAQDGKYRDVPNDF
jgi:hypothetical protein